MQHTAWYSPRVSDFWKAFFWECSSLFIKAFYYRYSTKTVLHCLVPMQFRFAEGKRGNRIPFRVFKKSASFAVRELFHFFAFLAFGDNSDDLHVPVSSAVSYLDSSYQNHCTYQIRVKSRILCEATVIDHRYHLFYCIVKVYIRTKSRPEGQQSVIMSHFTSLHFATLVIHSTWTSKIRSDCGMNNAEDENKYDSSA